MAFRKVPFPRRIQCTKLKLLAFCFKSLSIEPFRMKELSSLCNLHFIPKVNASVLGFLWKVTSRFLCILNAKDITKTADGFLLQI